ncbi:MAG: hypothetical protein ACLSXI_05660 [Sarcina ventriculi]
MLSKKKLLLGVVSENAVAQGFSAAILVAFIIVIVGLIASIVFIGVFNKNSKDKK